MRCEWLFLMPRTSKPRAGKSYERSELDFDAESPHLRILELARDTIVLA